MSGGMCKNCVYWHSTDQTWGECSQIIADYPNGAQKRASINCYRSDAEDFEEIGLWSAHDFGCREWKSLHATLKRIADRKPTGNTPQPQDSIDKALLDQDRGDRNSLEGGKRIKSDGAPP